MDCIVERPKLEGGGRFVGKHKGVRYKILAHWELVLVVGVHMKYSLCL